MNGGDDETTEVADDGELAADGANRNKKLSISFTKPFSKFTKQKTSREDSTKGSKKKKDKVGQVFIN